jgi:hypothetical protein
VREISYRQHQERNWLADHDSAAQPTESGHRPEPDEILLPSRIQHILASRLSLSPWTTTYICFLFCSQQSHTDIAQPSRTGKLFSALTGSAFNTKVFFVLCHVKKKIDKHIIT